MKTLKKFEFKSFGADSEYDWDKLTDGGIYQLEAGTDYKCKDATFSTLARTAGRRRGKTVKVGSVDGGLVIQAEDATRDQIAKWAEQDAANAVKKAEKKAAAAAG